MARKNANYLSRHMHISYVHVRDLRCPTGSSVVWHFAAHVPPKTTQHAHGAAQRQFRCERSFRHKLLLKIF